MIKYSGFRGWWFYNSYKVILPLSAISFVSVLFASIYFSLKKNDELIKKYQSACQTMPLIDVKSYIKTYAGCLKEDGSIRYVEIK